MKRSLVQDPVIAHQLAVVGEEHHDGVAPPPAVLQAVEDAPHSLVHQAHHPVGQRPHLRHLRHLRQRRVIGHDGTAGYPHAVRVVVELEVGRHQRTVVAPRLGARHVVRVVAGMPRRRRSERLVGIGKGAPQEEGPRVAEPVERLQGALGDPLGVVQLLGDRREVAVAVQGGPHAGTPGKVGRGARMMILQPVQVLPEHAGAVSAHEGGLFEAEVGSGQPGGEPLLPEMACLRQGGGIVTGDVGGALRTRPPAGEVRLAHQGGLIARAAQQLRQHHRVRGEVDAVGAHPVSAG